MEQRKQLGNTSEALAQAYLEKQGFLLLQANFSCKRGELDLIMRRDQLLLFVEVRSKTNQRYGLPLETVTYKKRKNCGKRQNIICIFTRSWQSCIVGLMLCLLCGREKMPVYNGLRMHFSKLDGG